MRRILTRADDFGASPGTNTAILEVIAAGLIRNVGVMVPGPCLEHRFAELQACQRDVRIGLHAVLTSEWATVRWGPVSAPEEVTSLIGEDGSFHPTAERLHRFGLPEEGILETAAQLSRLRTLGIEPVYLDCHMAFNWHPDWDRAMGEFAAREGLVYHAHGMLPAVHLDLAGTAFPSAGDILDKMNQQDASSAVWVFHPARRDTFSEQFYTETETPSAAVAKNRDREYRFLTSTKTIRSFLESQELELIGYDQLHAVNA